MTRTLRALLIGALLWSGCDKAQTPQALKAQAPGAQSPKAQAAAPRQASGEDFSFDALTHQVEANSPATIAFSVRPGAGLKINPEYPWKVTLSADAPVTISSRELRQGALTLRDEAATIPVALTAPAGEHTIQASVNLSVCETGAGKRCLWFTEQLATLQVVAK